MAELLGFIKYGEWFLGVCFMSTIYYFYLFINITKYKINEFSINNPICKKTTHIAHTLAASM